MRLARLSDSANNASAAAGGAGEQEGDVVPGAGAYYEPAPDQIFAAVEALSVPAEYLADHLPSGTSARSGACRLRSR
jgi:hypothetical protein